MANDESSDADEKEEQAENENPSPVLAVKEAGEGMELGASCMTKAEREKFHAVMQKQKMKNLALKAKHLKVKSTRAIEGRKYREAVEKKKNALPKWKRAGRAIMDDPKSSKLARVWFIFLIIFICVSSITLALSTVPQYSHYPWEEVELVTNIVFSLELAARFMLAVESREIWGEVFNWFDMLSVLPFWVGFLVNAKTPVFKIMSALKMLRVLKLSRSFDGSIVIAKAMERSAAALTVPIFFLAVGVVVSATFLFYLESEAHLPGEEPAFMSVPHAIWFMCVTMTTVGYGDVSPATSAGKFITVLAMVFGVLFLAMPLAIVGNNFCTIWDDKVRIVFIHHLREQLSVNDISKEAVVGLFRRFDNDNSGEIDFGEFRKILAELDLGSSTRRALDLWKAIDYDSSGSISEEEFLHLVFDGDRDSEENSLKESLENETRRGQHDGGPPASQAVKAASGTASGGDGHSDILRAMSVAKLEKQHMDTNHTVHGLASDLAEARTSIQQLELQNAELVKLVQGLAASQAELTETLLADRADRAGKPLFPGKNPDTSGAARLPPIGAIKICPSDDPADA